MTTVAAPEAENPKTATDLNLLPPTTADDAIPSDQLPASSAGGDNDESEPTSDAPAKTTGVETASTVVQKKMKRAERFGVAVQLSEAEKRNSRAERFGTGPTASAVNGSDSTKQAEDLKRKARAERFGIAQSAPADDDVKKKARLARFGSSAKTDSVEEDKKKPKTDSVEEEKKKARALRFSQLDAGKKSNGSEKVEVNTADTGKAVEEPK